MELLDIVDGTGAPTGETVKLELPVFSGNYYEVL